MPRNGSISPMTRRHRDQTFRKADVVRAYRAALTAGMKQPRLVIDTIRRTITILPGKSADGDEHSHGGETNAWDEVLTDATK